MTNGNMYGYESQEGMALRDYFAAAAIAYVTDRLDHDEGATEWAAKRCYALADALLKERELDPPKQEPGV